MHEPVGRVHFVVFEKFTRAYLFQIALEIMWLPILIIRLFNNNNNNYKSKL